MKPLFQSFVLFVLLFSLNAQAYNSNGTLTVNGLARTFVFHSAGANAPTASSNLPLFIMMHGDGGSGSGIKSYCGLDAIADANNFIAVYPDGQMAGSSRTWNQYIDGTPGRPDNANLVNDIPFLDALIEHFKTTYGINCQKVYAAGHSSGAFMAYYAAIAMPNKIAAIAPYAGSIWYDTNDPVSNAYYNANFDASVPVLHIHGSADNTVNPPATTWSWPLMLYIQGSGCNPGNATLDASLYPNANANAYYAQSYYYNQTSGGGICATAPYKHRLVLINSQGHGWPTQDTNEFNIAQEMWSFVNQYTLSATCQAVEPPPTTSVDNRIKVDQFGYQTNAQKVAVISNPQIGYNVSTNFIPGSVYQVRSSLDSSVVFSGSPVAWNGGTTHSQSGDKVWWFDFSTLITEGTYHIYDPSNNVTSYEFEISDCVYDATMRQAVRTFYYQRCGSPKSTPHAHANWEDATACHLGTLQDHNCRSILNPTAASSKDLWGGWHDAGDYNKYVNFLYETMIDLLLAYEEKPTAWADDYNIPESGNGVPDLLDETKYELDWLLRMQQTDGGVLCVVGVQNYASASPPSADNAQRFYGPATTSASYTAAAIFALAAKQYNSIGMTAYATTLQTAAINAYNWANANPNITYYNAGTVAAGEQEISTYDTQARRLAAAVFLYTLTNTATYKTYVESNYTSLHLFQWSFAYPFEAGHQSAILYYSKQMGITNAVKNNIQNTYSNSLSTGNADNLPAYTNNTDAYRAYLSDNNYTWGSNTTKARQGSMLASMNVYSLDAANATNYNNAAAGYIHYMHGINPIAITYLSNMSSYGAENSVNEFYHGWFTDGSALWDRVGVSTYGPAPGFIPGGANPTYNPDGSYVGPAISPPQNQPIQKSFKDWNTSYPQNSWEITENAIYTQASYIRLLAQYMCCSVSQNIVIAGSENACGNQSTTYNVAAVAGATYTWTVTGGSITSGQGTNQITVQWSNGTAGTVSVEQTVQ